MFNPANIPAWVSGGATNDGSVRKYHRAVSLLQKQNADLKAQGKEAVEITEDAVKALYEKYGGNVIEVPVIETQTQESSSVPMARVEEEVPVVKKSKKAE